MEDRKIRQQQEAFFRWLSEKTPASLVSDMYTVIPELDEYGKGKRFVKKSVFELTDVATLIRFRMRFESDKVYRFTHYGKMPVMLAILKYMIEYLNEKKSKPNVALPSVAVISPKIPLPVDGNQTANSIINEAAASVPDKKKKSADVVQEKIISSDRSSSSPEKRDTAATVEAHIISGVVDQPKDIEKQITMEVHPADLSALPVKEEQGKSSLEVPVEEKIEKESVYVLEDSLGAYYGTTPLEVLTKYIYALSDRTDNQLMKCLIPKKEFSLHGAMEYAQYICAKFDLKENPIIRLNAVEESGENEVPLEPEVKESSEPVEEDPSEQESYFILEDKFGSYTGKTPKDALTEYVYSLSARTNNALLKGMAPKSEIAFKNASLFAEFLGRQYGGNNLPVMREVVGAKSESKETSIKQKEIPDTSDFRHRLDDEFRSYLRDIKKLAVPTVIQYSQSIEAIEQFIHEKGLGFSLDITDADKARKIMNVLLARDDFVAWNNQRHHQYSAALAQYVSYLGQAESETKESAAVNTITITDAAVTVLQEAKKPLTISEILQRIESERLYRFNTDNPAAVLYVSIRRCCKGIKGRNHASVDVFERLTDAVGQIRYSLIDKVQKTDNNVKDQDDQSKDVRWQPILQDSFPDGYMLNDPLSQFQAAAFWQERYGKDCPIQDDAIDEEMKAIGIVRDGRVFAKKDEDKQLISSICADINNLLSVYTTVYRSCIYDRYQDQLAASQIYTEAVMTQQLLSEAEGSFYSVNQVFAKHGQYASVIQDARKVLRDHGGAMPVIDVANVLWFIPYDMVYHYLSVDDESLNIGNSTWMLAEHFPLSREDADMIGKVLDEYFVTNQYVQAFDLLPLLQKRLPGIADNLSGLNYSAIFNIVAYYLKDRFSFTKAVISPKGSSVDFTNLFKTFVVEHETFTLEELEAFARELKVPIYWESSYDAGAVRVSKTEFVNKRLIKFDVTAIDEVLTDFCPGDYLPLQAVSSAMMMHLPSCGYRWNGYLLQSYIRAFSLVFRLSYSSLGKTGFYGAMVRRDCKTINNYGSLLVRVLSDDDTWETTADALELLVRNGYQANRKYKGIDHIVAKAKQNKQSDGRR